jgi:molybdenum cofactor biosynthesis enzyme
MARPKKYPIELTDTDVKTIKCVLRKKNTSRTIRARCQILLDLDERHGKTLTHEQSAKSNGVCIATVTNTVSAYVRSGLEGVLSLKRSENSNNARRVLDGRAEAIIIAMACGPVPEGHCRWTLRLLEEKSRVQLETPVSREAIRRALKKTNFILTTRTTGAFLPKKTRNL